MINIYSKEKKDDLNELVNGQDFIEKFSTNVQIKNVYVNGHRVPLNV